jgi:hypothetical protein
MARSALFGFGILIVIASAVFAFGNRYSAGPSASGVIWVLDRLTGDIQFCGITGCIRPMPSPKH